MVTVFVKRLDDAVQLPQYHTDGASGMDLRARIALDILPGARATVPTGLGVSVPDGYEAQVRSRSGLARDLGLVVLNAPGTIDSDYRGEISVLLINHGDRAVHVGAGSRIAQLVFAPVARAVLFEIADLGLTARGPGGFGSTGS